jgi:hypothetical protein
MEGNPGTGPELIGRRAASRRTGGHNRKANRMGFDQYHEPPNELSQKTRTFARMCTSVIEEAEAIGWYEQRISLEKDPEAKAIMKAAQKEEFKHFGMDLEFLLRRKPEWRAELKEILFSRGSIVKAGERGEKKAE